MHQVNIHEAKTLPPKRVKIATVGEEVVIGKSGKPIAHLIPMTGKSVTRKKGPLKGKIRLSAEFGQPLPDEIIAFFVGGVQF